MGAIHGLRVKSPYQLLKIEDIKIENKPNEHGYLYLKCLIDDSISFQSTINASADDKITVFEELEDENKRVVDENPVNINEVDKKISKSVFDGIIKNVKTTNKDGIYYLEIEALTSSIELDIKEKSRSFQNTNMTYDNLISSILKDYSGYKFTQCIGNGKKIGKALFQYKETDWNFLKRIASELNSELYCNITQSSYLFYFGRPSNESYNIEDMKYYKVFKDLHRFKESSENSSGHESDYFYYEIERRERYEVGDEINFKNKRLYVNKYSAYAFKDEVIYKYRLCRKNGVWQARLYNSLLSGASLEGKVIATEGEKVKLHLTIDENQNKDEATWFPFAPPTGNMMYSMPVVGTNTRLYFLNESGEEPIVTGCLRTNGGDCKKTSDTTKRYFGTEHGSEIEMLPDAINIKGGSSSPLSLKFEDNVGITLTSHKKLSISSENIILRTAKNLTINAQSNILVTNPSSKSGISIENEFYCLGENVIKSGRDSVSYETTNDDEPQAVKEQEDKGEKKEIDWNKVKEAALAVAFVAVVSLFTFGVATTLVLGAVMGTLAVVSTMNNKAGKIAYTTLEIVGGALTVAASGIVLFRTRGKGKGIAAWAGLHGANSFANGVRDINHLMKGEIDDVGSENFLRDDFYKPTGEGVGKFVGSIADYANKKVSGKDTNFAKSMGEGGAYAGYYGYYLADMYFSYSTVKEASKVMNGVEKIKELKSTYYLKGNPLDGYVLFNDLKLADKPKLLERVWAGINGSINENSLYYNSNDIATNVVEHK